MKRARLLVAAVAASLVLALMSAPAHADTALTVSGTVVGHDSKPVPFYDGQSSLYVHLFDGAQNLHTVPVAADGGFAISGVAPGQYGVRLQYTGDLAYPNQWWGGTFGDAPTRLLTVDGETPATVDAQLVLGARLTGSVTGDGGDLAGSQGLMASWLEIVPPAGVSERLHFLDTMLYSSAYTSKPLPPGDYGVVFHGGPLWVDEDHNGVQTSTPTQPLLSLASGDVRRLDADLESNGRVSGTVRVRAADGTTTPFPSGVSAYRVENGEGVYVGSAQGQPDGTFVMRGLAAGEYYFEFAPRGGELLPLYSGGVRDPEDAQRYTLDARAVLTGLDAVVEYASEAAIAAVQYRPAPGASPEWMSLRTDAQVSVWRLDEAAGFYFDVTDETSVEYLSHEEGWKVYGLEEGVYSFRFDATDPTIGSEYYEDARYFAERTDVVVGYDETVALGTITLEPRVFDVWRLAGGDRYATAVAITQDAVRDGERIDTVYLASGTEFADALAAGPAAIADGGVLLLTAPKALPEVVRAELQRLKPKRIVIVGGTGAVSSTVESRVRAAVPSAAVTRLSGASRYETAQAIARSAFKSGASIAFVATGRSYADALSAGPAAGVTGAPVVLVDGAAKGLPAATAKLLRDLGVDEVIIAGGLGAVSDGVEADLAAVVGLDNVYRASGGDRYETAAIINTAFFDRPDYAFLASGLGFADALAGVPLAGMYGVPLYLTNPSCLSSQTASSIMAQRANGIILLGGRGALSAKVENLGSC